jgi:sodium-dependent dicarboxylate transporter 2/3/5
LDKLQIVFFFISGFLVSRAMIKARLPQKLVRLLLGESHNSLSLTLLYLIGAASAMSFFIPNAITMLTLLPVLDLLSRAFRESGDHRVPTILTLAVLYGANIGGMGSVTGTPTNLLFVGYLKANGIPGVDAISFLSWLAWGVPLVIIVALIAWGVLCIGFHTWREDAEQVQLPFAPEETEHPLQRQAFVVTLVYLLSSVLLSYLLSAYPPWQTPILAATGGITLWLAWFLFFHRIDDDGPFLTVPDTYSDLPKKGLELLAFVLVLGGIMYALNLEAWLATQAASMIPSGISIFVLFLFIALVTSFTTEVFSNTVVQLALFLVLLPIAEAGGFPPAQALLVVTLSCTCAFMSPIATPVNALAFGGIQGESLWRWLATGAVMNAFAATAITAYVLAFVDLGAAG